MINNLFQTGAAIQYLEQCPNSILPTALFTFCFEIDTGCVCETMSKINGRLQRNWYTKGLQSFIIVGKNGKHLVLDLFICLANVVPILIGATLPAKESLKLLSFSVS